MGIASRPSRAFPCQATPSLAEQLRKLVRAAASTRRLSSRARVTYSSRQKVALRRQLPIVSALEDETSPAWRNDRGRMPLPGLRLAQNRLLARGGDAGAPVGLLQWRYRHPLERRWPQHDFVAGATLHRSERERLDRARGLRRGWGLDPALALVIDGRTVRRPISQRLGPA